MKPILANIAQDVEIVAPHAGARIETPTIWACRCRLTSPPTRGRGLKPWLGDRHRPGAPVAPHAGARIETPAPAPG